jgi:hypothetical protein
MSLDLELYGTPCKECGHTKQCMSFNYTYNVSHMWYSVFPDDEGMVYIEGFTGKGAVSKLKKAIYEMKDKKKFMKKLEPDNGWGSYEGFLEFLNKLLQASEEFPDSIWRADR